MSSSKNPAAGYSRRKIAKIFSELTAELEDKGPDIVFDEVCSGAPIPKGMQGRPTYEREPALNEQQRGAIVVTAATAVLIGFAGILGYNLYQVASAEHDEPQIVVETNQAPNPTPSPSPTQSP